MRRSNVVIVVAVLTLPFLAGAKRRTAPQPINLVMHRSFAITDQAILDGFSFERVMNTLVEGTNTTATQLYQQWLDTQNPKPGLAVADAPHCDDFLVDGKPGFNGFPRRCPTPEGSFATEKPFAPRRYIPIAIINRFDLTPLDGSNCGQYRLIFARLDNTVTIPGLIVLGDTLHFIFEGVLPNPRPESGLAGCRPVAQFWADLSNVDSISARRARLEEFFFAGLPGFAPAIRAEHYGRSTGGGIRSFQWQLKGSARPRFYQFQLEKRCAGAQCRVVMEPAVLENLAMGKFFDARIKTPQAERFRDFFITQVKTLTIPDKNQFFLNIPSEFLLGESDPIDSEPLFIYFTSFSFSLNSPEGQEFSRRIESEARRLGSNLSAIQIVNRAQSQNCYGCHSNAELNFDEIPGGPPLLPIAVIFQHVSERNEEKGEAGNRFAISRAMRETFIPHRMEVLRTFLTSEKLPVRSNVTIGGDRAVH